MSESVPFEDKVYYYYYSMLIMITILIYGDQDLKCTHFLDIQADTAHYLQALQLCSPDYSERIILLPILQKYHSASFSII